MSQTLTDDIVPDSVIPHGQLPPLRYRDMPAPMPLRRMIGPSIILAGLSLGSGEFIIWPKIVSKSGFVFFWACVLGVATQYFMNMEIMRWTLATGESAITGMLRLSRRWGWLLLVANIVPWMIPAWAVGSAQMLSWLVMGPPEPGMSMSTPYLREMTIAGLVICGIVLTAGPVIYETIERIQMVLVGLIIVLIIVLACYLVRGDAVIAMAGTVKTIGQLPTDVGLPRDLLLGAIAFAGAGGTLNLGQSNYIKEKGYGMGHYIGRITSPLTGKAETVAETGYTFPETPENMAHWQVWWRRAGWEHFWSFFITCLVCLMLLALISYSIFYTSDGQLQPGLEQYISDMKFIWGETMSIEQQLGKTMREVFLLMGMAILLTTELGVLDGTSRISTDLVKVNWLRENKFWTESRLYLAFLWTTIALGIGLLYLLDIDQDKGSVSTGGGPFKLFVYSSALNGAVMFVYCGLLLYINRWKLPAAIRINGWRSAIMAWSVLFFGTFAALALWDKLFP